MKLYGSQTSPYVRRIRFLALELGIPFDFVDTFTDGGQKELREKNPLWKVPYVEMDGLQIWDSHSITDYLLSKYPAPSIRSITNQNRWSESNTMHAIDGALDSGINLFYLNKDGIATANSTYLTKQKDRIPSALTYLRTLLADGYFTSERKLGITEINLYTTLDWFLYRNVYPVLAEPIFNAFLSEHGKNENWRKTAPPEIK